MLWLKSSIAPTRELQTTKQSQISVPNGGASLCLQTRLLKNLTHTSINNTLNGFSKKLPKSKRTSSNSPWARSKIGAVRHQTFEMFLAKLEINGRPG